MQQRLADFSKGEDDVALDALVLLAQQTLAASSRAPAQETGAEQKAAPGSPIPREELVTRIKAHPLAAAPHHLLAVDLEMQAKPGDKDALRDAAIARYKEGEAETLVVLATWLNGHREFERTLSEIPLEKALGSRALFLQHVDALGALGNWAEIKRLLESERFPLDAVIQKMYLARCNAQLGEATAAENNWNRALEAAGGDVQKLMPLADYAEKNGAAATAAAAYDAAAAAAPRLRPAQEGRVRLAQAARETRRLHAILAEMLPLWPEDTAIQNDEAYLRVLLEPGAGATRSDAGDQKSEGGNQVAADVGSQVAKSGDQKTETQAQRGRSITRPNRHRILPYPSRLKLSGKRSPISLAPDLNPSATSDLVVLEELAKGLVEKEPASLPHRTLLALIRLKRGQAAGALEVYADLNVAPAALTPSALAVHAAVLAANGKTEAAQQEIAQIPRDRLLAEERALIEGL